MVDQAEIHRIAWSEDAYEREEAAYQFFFYFKEFPDKEQAWKDLCQLTNDKINNVRKSATEALGMAFPYIPDKLEAWNNLHRLTWDMEYVVRIFAAEAIGVAFVHVPDKKQAWYDLYRLTLDEKRIVRPAAFLSLGRASIFKAIDAENKEKFKKDMEEAISYFEKSLTQIFFSNPAKFCLPFYRSFYTLTFKIEDVDTEVREYLARAKSAVEGSKSKAKLLEAVENLGNALKEAQKARDFSDIKADLNVSRRYLDRACELLDSIEEKAPGASRLIRKGLPIIDERIRGIIVEIQETAKAACQQSLGTPAEELACTANREIQKWHIDDQEQMTWAVENLIFSLSMKIPIIPENKRIFDKIEEIKNEGNIIKQYQSLSFLVGLIPTVIVHSHEPAKKTWIDILNSSATVAAFAGFIAVEIGTYFYPLSYNHLISVIAAAISFTIVAMLNRR